MNKNNNLIGIFVLSIGTLALILVGGMAYKKLFPSSAQKNEITKNDADIFKRTESANRALGEKRKKKKKIIYKRQKSISEKEMKGLWEASLKSGKTLLEMRENTYRLVIIKKRNSSVRYYSNGTYKIKDDLVILLPDKKSVPPQTGDSYSNLTVSEMPVIATKYKGKLIWQIPPNEVDIYVPPYHPLLNLADDKILVWNVLD